MGSTIVWEYEFRYLFYTKHNGLLSYFDALSTILIAENNLDRGQKHSYSDLLVPLGFDVLSFLFYSGAQTLMSGSNPMLGCNTGAIAPAGINLSGILPSGGLVPSALPAAMQSASQAG